MVCRGGGDLPRVSSLLEALWPWWGSACDAGEGSGTTLTFDPMRISTSGFLHLLESNAVNSSADRCQQVINDTPNAFQSKRKIKYLIVYYKGHIHYCEHYYLIEDAGCRKII